MVDGIAGLLIQLISLSFGKWYGTGAGKSDWIDQIYSLTIQ
jgi:hypothetical protein